MSRAGTGDRVEVARELLLERDGGRTDDERPAVTLSRNETGDEVGDALADPRRTFEGDQPYGVLVPRFQCPRDRVDGAVLLSPPLESGLAGRQRGEPLPDRVDRTPAEVAHATRIACA